MKKLPIFSFFMLLAFAGCKKMQQSGVEVQAPETVRATDNAGIRAILHSTGCTYSWGYWKTHGPEGCSKGNNNNEWPVTELTIAGVTYSDSQLCAIMQTSAKNDIKIQLMHQLIGAMLNVANGASNYAFQAMEDAETAIANNDMSNASNLIAELDEYNLGGPDGLYHCGDSNGGIIGEP